MKYPRGGARILLVGKQDNWRGTVAQSLTQAGFTIAGTGEQSPAWETATPVDLVIVGCSRIGPDELALIRDIAAHKWHLLVFSSHLPWDSMRAAFLAGADDVTEKTYDSEETVETVYQVIETIATKDSYSLARG